MTLLSGLIGDAAGSGAIACPSARAVRRSASDDLAGVKGQDGTLAAPTPLQRLLLASFQAMRTRLAALYGAELLAAARRLAELAEATRHLGAQKGVKERELAAVRLRQEALTPRQRLSRIHLPEYLLLLGLSAASEYVLLHVVFSPLPLANREIELLSLLVGGSLVALVHCVAHVAVAHQRHPHRAVRQRRESRTDTVGLVVGLVVIAVLIGVLAVARGEMLESLAQLLSTHRSSAARVGYPVSLRLVLGLLQFAAVVAAWLFALRYAQGGEWRELDAEGRGLEKEVEALGKRRHALEVERVGVTETKRSCQPRAQQAADDELALHRLREAEYLGIIARELDTPPAPLPDWGDTGVRLDRGEDPGLDPEEGAHLRVVGGDDA